jgi:hypothetical protein
MSDFVVDPDLRFAVWQKIAGQAHALGRFGSHLLSCDSISSMIGFVFRIHANSASFCENVNYFIRRFPISLVLNFMDELKGVLSYVYLLQSSIACLARENPIRDNLVVYRGIRQAADRVMLYESAIGDVVVWPEFTSAFTDLDYVLNHFITDEDCVLFKIELHPGDVAVQIERYSADQAGDEVLIAASTGFRIDSVDDTDVSIPAEDGCLNLFHLPTIGLSYFLHWYDFDLDQRPPRVVV